MLLTGILLGLFVLVLLVVVHELGHAIVARRNGVVVEEFGIGFPPRAWSKKLKSGILFSLNYLPLGGFVRLQGEYDSARQEGDYGAASFWVKTKILLAGVLINWLVAALIFSGLALVGLPKILPNQFSVASDTSLQSSVPELVTVVDGSPAERAGLQVGDHVQRLGGVDINSATELSEMSEARAGETVTVDYTRNNEARTAQVTLNEDRHAGQGYLGVSSGQYESIRATWSAPIVGVVTTAQYTYETVRGVGAALGNLVSGLVFQLSFNQDTRDTGDENLTAARDSVAGPVGILGTIFPAAGEGGIIQVLNLAGIISLTLAVMNTLPIPALDGGRWFTMAIFRVLRQPLTRKREETIQATGFLLLMTLIIVVTLSDVSRFFN